MKRLATGGLLLVLSAAVAASTGAVTVHSAPRLPQVSIGKTTATEGDAGSKNAVFSVRLSSSSSHRVSVRVATSDDSASAGSDYRARHAVVRFRPGQRTAPFTVPVLGDTEPEEAESFLVHLSQPRGARLGRKQASATIPENDLPAPFQVTSTLLGTYEVEEHPSPTGRGELTMTVDALHRQITFTLRVAGMTLGDSGFCRGEPMRPMTEIITRFGDPTGPGVTEGAKQIALKPILKLYKSPSSFCARATTPTRSEFIRGQLARG